MLETVLVFNVAIVFKTTSIQPLPSQVYLQERNIEVYNILIFFTNN